jgi:hypothetical protein
MLNIEESLNHKFPRFARSAPMLRKPTLGLLRKLVHERAINQFLEEHRGAPAASPHSGKKFLAVLQRLRRVQTPVHRPARP